MTIGLIHPDQGDVYFKGQNITNSPSISAPTSASAISPKNPRSSAQLTVEDNILCILETLPSTSRAKTRLTELLQELHLEHLPRKKRAPFLAASGAALKSPAPSSPSPPSSSSTSRLPTSILSPSPTSNTSSASSRKSKSASSSPTTTPARSFPLSIGAISIQEGKVILSGTVDELLHSKEARSSYFGEDFRL